MMGIGIFFLTNNKKITKASFFLTPAANEKRLTKEGKKKKIPGNCHFPLDQRKNNE